MMSFEFSGHVLDLRQGRLRRGSAEISLRPKSLALLTFLLQNRGRVIGKDELLSAVWPGFTVSEDSLTQCIADIRRSLGSQASDLIRTVPRRGYILEDEQVALVEPIAGGQRQWPAPDGAEPVQSLPRETNVYLVSAEPAPEGPGQASLLRPSALPPEYSWKEGEGMSWQAFAPPATLAALSFLAACAALLTPPLGAELTFSYGVAFLVLVAALLAVKVKGTGIDKVATIQLASTAVCGLGLSIGGTSLHLFADRTTGGILLMLSVMAACLCIYAAHAQPARVPPQWRLFGGVTLLLAASLAACLLPGGGPASDPGRSMAFLALALLQMPTLTLMLLPHFASARDDAECRFSAEVFPLGFMTIGGDLIYDFELKRRPTGY